MEQPDFVRYGDREYVRIGVDEIRRETAKAFLLVVDGDEYWIPKSQMRDPDQHLEGDTDCEVEMTEWIAREKGLD